MESKVIRHHGILGMKWGIRRFQNKDGSLTPAGRKRQQSNGEEQKENSESSKTSSSKSISTKKSISEMSNEEIEERMKRIKLENDYKTLLEGQGKEQVSKGKKFVSEVLENSGKNIATQTVTFLMGTAVNKALEKTLGIENAINPKKGQKDK